MSPKASAAEPVVLITMLVQLFLTGHLFVE